MGLGRGPKPFRCLLSRALTPAPSPALAGEGVGGWGPRKPIDNRMTPAAARRGLSLGPRTRYGQGMGEVAALLSALTWAGSNAMMGAQLARVPAVVVSAVRLLGGMLMLWILSAALRVAGQSEGLNLHHALALVGSAVVGLAAGDTLYFSGMRHIGLARATPISMATFPLFTFVLAAVLLGESITPSVVGGAVLIMAGLYLVSRRSRSGSPTEVGGRLWWGVGLVVGAALLWALAGVWLRVGSAGVSPALAGAVRLSAAGLVTLMAVRVVGHTVQPWRYGRHSVLVLFAAGMFGTGLGSMFYVIGVQHAGVARAAILSSTTPLFALPMAALVLHERLTARLIGGALISVVGIWLVTV
jgi:drug/metabolite transporter (DMT)-like permease